ncbi:MAG: zinc-ribbon domain-containing protein [Sphingomonas sp.]
MILTCPSCGTQYVVKDDAVPPEGRQVRCAACKHSWHQDFEQSNADAPDDQAAIEASPDEQEVPVPDADEPEDDEGLTEATLIEPRSGPEAEERAYEEAVIEGAAEPVEAPAAEAESGAPAAPAEQDWNAPPHAEAAPDMFSPFAAEDELEPRRRGALTSILIVAFIIILLAALFWFFAPLELKARLGLAAAGTSPLALVTTHMDRQRLESGNELLTVTGRVINPTAREQDVPPLQAQLRSSAGKVVYSWTIAPPARTLAAGESRSFNSAEVNVPPGGDELTITLGQPKA